MAVMRWTSLFVVLMACGDPSVAPDASVVADVGTDAPNVMPQSLAESGLCVDAACTQIAANVYAYTPKYELYSDGASKQRWIYVPPDAKINTANMDFWEFPVGTKVWKEFTRDNIRVETRLIMRVAANGTNSDWFYVPYVWNGTATTAQPNGVANANGTQHDVPSRFQCKGCHDTLLPTRVLGFDAIQLAWNNPDPAQLDLEKLVELKMLSNEPSGAAPYFAIGGTATEQAALGYMHANCGHCHNSSSPVQGNTPLQLRLTVGTAATPAQTPTYKTSVDAGGNQIGNPTRSKIVVPGAPDQSILTYRFESLNTVERMPALGSEVIDDAAKTMLRTWITNLQ